MTIFSLTPSGNALARLADFGNGVGRGGAEQERGDGGVSRHAGRSSHAWHWIHGMA